MAASDEPLGKRKSKAPKAFQPTYGSFSKGGAGAELESPIGEGDSLQSIPVIKERLGALNQDAAELKFLHSVIFGNEGENRSRKKMLLEFKGLSGGSSASTDAMRVRANRVLLEPATRGMVPTIGHILALAVTGNSGKAVSQIVQFLCVPSQKLCTELDSGAPVSGEDAKDDEQNGKAPVKEPRAKPSAPRNTAKKAREGTSQSEEEPSRKRQRGARGSKPTKAAAKKTAAKNPAAKKPAKRKASEVEAKVEPEVEEAVEAEAEVEAEVPVEEHVPEEEQGDGEQPDEEMQEEAEAEEPIDQQEEEAEEDPEAEDDEEEAPGLDMHPDEEPPVVGGPQLQHEVPDEAVQHEQEPLMDDEDDEEPEPPPPGLENDMEHAQARRADAYAAYAAAHPGRPQPAAVVAPPQRPGIGSQASPCDAAQPVSHGRSMPPQLGPHALQPPLEGVATSSRAAASHDIGNSISKARARGNKRSRVPATKASLGVQGGTASKKSAPYMKRGATAVAAAAAVAAATKLDAKKSREKSQPAGDITKTLLQQAEKHQEALIAVQNQIQSLVDDHSVLLKSLRKVAGASS